MSSSGTTALHGGEDLLALRTHIGRLAVICGVDINSDDNVSRLLAGDYSKCHQQPRQAETLRGLLVLLYRLEASVSEDLGIDGLVGLWQQHNAILIQHGFPVSSQPVPSGTEL